MKDITTEEAIKILRQEIDTDKQNLPIAEANEYEEERQLIISRILATEKVLNELDTLQNGFNTAVEHQTELIRENTNFRYQLFNNKKELEKKDKIINAMFHEYEYNARINIKDYCDDEIRKDTCIQDCENCIKQYFEREVKD